MNIIAICLVAFCASSVSANTDDGDNNRSLRGSSSPIQSFGEYVNEVHELIATKETCLSTGFTCHDPLDCCSFRCVRTVVNGPSKCAPRRGSADFDSSYEVEDSSTKCTSHSDCSDNLQCVDKSNGNCFFPPCGRCMSTPEIQPINDPTESREVRPRSEDESEDTCVSDSDCSDNLQCVDESNGNCFYPPCGRCMPTPEIQPINDQTESREIMPPSEDEPEDFLDVGCIIGPQATCKCRRSRCERHSDCCSQMCRFTGRTYYQCV